MAVPLKIALTMVQVNLFKLCVIMTVFVQITVKMLIVPFVSNCGSTISDVPMVKSLYGNLCMMSKSTCPMVESVTGIALIGHELNIIKAFSHWTLEPNSMRIGRVHTLHSQFCLG